MKLWIKNMVCPRCIMVVEKEAQKLDLPIKVVELGSIEFSSVLDDGYLKKFETRMAELGFEILHDGKNKTGGGGQKPTHPEIAGWKD